VNECFPDSRICAAYSLPWRYLVYHISEEKQGSTGKTGQDYRLSVPEMEKHAVIFVAVFCKVRYTETGSRFTKREEEK
jgi:hypothetical protein